MIDLIKTIKISQGQTKSFYIGKMKFSDLEKIASFNVRESSGDDGFNRETDKSRINKITEYIIDSYNNNSVAIFPTPIILGFVNNEDGDKTVNNFYYNLEDNNDFSILTIKEEKKNDYNLFKALIVDGQHRFKAIQQAKEKVTNFDMEISITILINYDIYELSRVFADINFKQKPVNRSLYFDIFGSIPDEVNDLKISHLLVKDFNDDLKSPFYNAISMLSTDKDKLLSQAFLLQKVNKFINKLDIVDTIKNDKIIVEKIQNNKENDTEINIIEDILKNYQYIEIKKYLFNYFNVIKQVFNKYSYNIDADGKVTTKGILFKTTGIGALFRLIDNFYNDFSLSTKEFLEKFESIESKGEEFFSNIGKYAKSGSEGSQSSLYKDLSSTLFYNGLIEEFRDELIEYTETIGNDEIILKNIYEIFEEKYQQKYPENKNIRAKIRQLLQILRDEGFLTFIGLGVYKINKDDLTVIVPVPNTKEWNIENKMYFCPKGRFKQNPKYIGFYYEGKIIGYGEMEKINSKLNINELKTPKNLENYSKFIIEEENKHDIFKINNYNEKNIEWLGNGKHVVYKFTYIKKYELEKMGN